MGCRGAGHGTGTPERCDAGPSALLRAHAEQRAAQDRAVAEKQRVMRELARRAQEELEARRSLQERQRREAA